MAGSDRGSMKKANRGRAAPNRAGRNVHIPAAKIQAGEVCSPPGVERLYSVSNHHRQDAGHSPTIDGDAPERYHGYFENRHGEQSLFVYDRNERPVHALVWGCRVGEVVSDHRRTRNGSGACAGGTGLAPCLLDRRQPLRRVRASQE